MDSSKRERKLPHSSLTPSKSGFESKRIFVVELSEQRPVGQEFPSAATPQAEGAALKMSWNSPKKGQPREAGLQWLGHPTLILPVPTFYQLLILL